MAQKKRRPASKNWALGQSRMRLKVSLFQKGGIAILASWYIPKIQQKMKHWCAGYAT